MQDLKSPNILIDSQWRIKIGDFGLSRLLKGGKKFVTASVESGTPEWMAPEILRTEGGSDKSDVSFVVVICTQHHRAGARIRLSVFPSRHLNLDNCPENICRCTAMALSCG